MDKVSHMLFISSVDEASLEAALAGWRAGHAGGGVCVLLPEAEKESVGMVQAACMRLGIPLIGAIFPALVRDRVFMTSGAWLLWFEEMPWYALHEELPAGGAEAEHAVERMAAAVREHIDHTPDLTLFMLFDAMVPNIASLLDSLYLQLANRVHYAGANAGSETFQPMPCLFDSTRIVQRGVLLMLLRQHKGAILEHGYHAPEQTSYATSTSGNRISQIDWRPAFEVYREMVRAQYGEEVTAENFYQYGVHFPFGIVRANHHVLVRIPVMLAEDGSLFCVGEVPPNSVLTLLKAPTVHTGETLQRLSNGLNRMDGGTDGAELLLFYCAGRRLHLGLEKATTELEQFHDMTRASQVAGALSLGEIGGSTLQGYPLFHNATLVASRW